MIRWLWRRRRTCRRLRVQHSGRRHRIAKARSREYVLSSGTKVNGASSWTGESTAVSTLPWLTGLQKTARESGDETTWASSVERRASYRTGTLRGLTPERLRTAREGDISSVPNAKSFGGPIGAGEDGAGGSGGWDGRGHKRTANGSDWANWTDEVSNGGSNWHARRRRYDGRASSVGTR